MDKIKKFLSSIPKIAWIVLLAAVLRLTLLDKVPPSLNWDEVSMGYSAYSLMQTGADEWGEKLPLFFRSYGEWKSAVYIYLLVPFIKVLGLNAWAVRLPAALAGVASVYLTYLIGKRLFGQKAGLFAALFLAVSPWHMMLSRPAFEANVALMLGLLGIQTLFLAADQGGWRNLLISAVSFGLAPHTYNSAKIIVPFLVLYLVLLVRKKLSFSKIAAYFSILAIFALPILLNMYTGRAQARYSQIGVTTDINLITEFYSFRKTFPLPENINKFIFNKPTLFTYKLIDNWLSYFSPNFLILSGGTHTQHSIPYRGVLYFVEFTLVIFGLIALKKHKSPYKFLPLVIIALGFIPPSTTVESRHVLRSILALPGWQLLAGLGLVSFVTKPKMKKVIYIGLTFEVIIFLVLYFTWYPKAFARDWQYGYKEAFEYTERHLQEYDRVVFTKWYGEPQLFYAFYSKLDPSWYQQEHKKLIRYEEEGKMWLDQLDTYEIGKYRFGYLEDVKVDGEKVLYVGKPDDFSTEANILKTIYFPDGEPAFYIVGEEQ